MRIAYVVYHLGERYLKGGVGLKIRMQMQLWQKNGHEAHLFIHTPDVTAFENASCFLYSDRLSTIPKENGRSKAMARMIERVAAYHPDVIYLRYGLYCWPLQRIFKIAPVVIEQNTIDLKEYVYRGKFFYWMNRLTRKQTMGRAYGVVTVTREIARQPENLALKKPFKVISNGFDMQKYSTLPAPNNANPRLVFIGTPGIPWQGQDKLWELARRYPDLQFDVVGVGPDQVEEETPPNIQLHGFVPVERVREILAHADVAFGQLALHRKNTVENSPLKVRESLGLGIPTVIAYEDTDVSGRGLEGVLEIPNTEDNVERYAQQIHDFAYAMRGKRVDREAMLPLIDQNVKEKERLAFFEEAIQQSTKRAV